MAVAAQPKVSVVIPVYNRSELLQRSLGSVLAQTMTHIDVWVVDDFSDAPLDEQIASFDDPRVHLIRLSKRSGVSAARNAGIERCQSDFVAFLDSDDYWNPDKLEKQFSFLQTHFAYRMVHSEELWIRNGKRVNPPKHYRKFAGDIFKPSLLRCIVSPSTVLMERSMFDDFGLFDTTLPVCEDYDMWLRILSKEEVGFLDEPLISKYGGHDDQLSTAYPAMDRYRIQSMIKLLREARLSSARQKAIHDVIHQKARILFQGAVKRNLPEADLYRRWMEQYGAE